MPIQHAVLGLLAGGPSYGYELKVSFEEAIGPQWGELNIGHLYQILDRLIRDGLVTRRTVTQYDRPDKLVYRLTAAGRGELRRWLDEPFMRSTGYRDDFFLKLFVASRLGVEALKAVVKGQRKVYLAELAGLGELKERHADEPLVGLLIDAAIMHTEANLGVLQLASERTKLLAQASTRVKTPALEVDVAGTA
jgi:DNA-binding PadR family transcriptional regulator